MNFSSKLLENAVNEMSQLPGIGKRTALRLVLFLLNQPKVQTKELSDSLSELVERVILCKNCHNISDSNICEICLLINVMFKCSYKSEKHQKMCIKVHFGIANNQNCCL